MPEVVVDHFGQSRYRVDEGTVDHIVMILETDGSELLISEDPGIVEQSLPKLWCGRCQGLCDGSTCRDCHLFPKGVE